MSRGTVSWHFAWGHDMWTLCRYWADAVNSTTDISKVNCDRCLLKWEEDRANR